MTNATFNQENQNPEHQTPQTAASDAFTREEFTLKSNHDGLELGVSLRIPQNAQQNPSSEAVMPKGIVQLVHGMAEHRSLRPI